ncbi:MAG: hypothetical protein MJ016_07115 [Victivallaceae bacterium]|nr:hypothetical protein [Victivallaceae bacterium]
MTVGEWGFAERDAALKWMSARLRDRVFPASWLPFTGLAAFDDLGRCRATLAVYLDATSPVAVLGWLVADPLNTDRESFAAARALLEYAPVYARSKQCVHLITMFGNRGINRLCDQLGYRQGDKGVEHKYVNLCHTN